ncbi:hypothetical protein Ahy_A06g030772 [Arachis hypogaea]|uniref:SWIM-type domain-containing protein n=1 Tax=Arachis hypogaea TaxID=3818 RepID=A0A445CXC4_ARAHY|nr:hypothetical protein Ahy_A06g030772 [Arachis hypogaea]
MDAVGDDVNVDVVELDWGEDNNDSEEEFEANYEVDDENDDGDLAGNLAAHDEAHAIVSQHPFGVPSFMRTLDLEAMRAPYNYYLFYLPCPTGCGLHVIGGGNAAAEDGEFSVGMEFGSRESMIFAIKSYTIYRRVDYTVYESEPQTFYAKCKGYGAWCDWLIRASLIRKKGCWEIRRYNGKHTCTMGTISQDHAKTEKEYNNNYQRLKERGNIVVNRFDRRNEMFEVHEMQDGSIYTVNLVQRHCDCGHFQVERLPCRHVLACCTNQRLD